MNDNGKILAALLAGMAAGAAIGILFAPDKGTDTREKITDSLKELGDAIKERSAEQLENLKDLKEDVLASVRRKVNKEQEDLDEALEHA